MIRLSKHDVVRYLALPCFAYIVLFFGGSEIIEHVYLNKLADSMIHWLHLIRGVFSVFFVAGLVLYSLSQAQRSFNFQMESVCSLLNAAKDGLIAFDQLGNVVSHNTRAAELLGSFDAGDFRLWKKNLHEKLKSQKEFECESPDSNSLLRVVALQSHESGTLLLLQDISTAKQTEEQWLIAEKMASVGRMAAGLAHEIGTPLNIISGRAELIQTAQANICGECTHECPVEKHTRVIFQQIERISRIIQQLLTQARQTNVDRELFSLNACVAKVTEFLQHETEKKNIQLQLKLQEDIPRLFGFADQFQQVLINLLTNSMDALEQGGTIEIITQCRGGCVELSVADSGCGISSDNLTKIFDPFFTTKEFGKGTGLGLTVTSNIIRSHGGSIEVQSKIGKGTRFMIHIPVAA